jgi:hypothetical protein
MNSSKIRFDVAIDMVSILQGVLFICCPDCYELETMCSLRWYKDLGTSAKAEGNVQDVDAANDFPEPLTNSK